MIFKKIYTFIPGWPLTFLGCDLRSRWLLSNAGPRDTSGDRPHDTDGDSLVDKSADCLADAIKHSNDALKQDNLSLSCSSYYCSC